jgi:hypothetical protein
MTTPRCDDARGVLRAAVWAAALSGAPSTIAALAAGTDPLAPTTAAGRMLLPRERRASRLVAAAALVHGGLSLGWTAVLARTVPRDAGRVRAALYGAAVGAVIAVGDLGVAHLVRGERFGAIAELDLAPQVADHLAFGAIAAWTLRS